MRQIVLTVAFSLAIIVSMAQEAVLISMEEVIARVEQNNHSIKIAQQDILVAKGNFQQSNAVLLPNIGISHTGISTTNPLMAFGAKLNQEIVTQEDFNPDLLNDPSQISDFATRIEIQQPILNFDGIYQRKAAKAKVQAAALQSARTLDQIIFDATQAYMQLQLAYKSLDVLEIAKQAALDNKRMADNQFAQGYLQQPDVLVMEVRVTELKNELQYAKSNILNASDYLSVLMNDTTFQVLKPSEALMVFPSSPFEKNLSENRSDLLAMRTATEAYRQQYLSAKMSFLPRLNAFGNYELHDNRAFHGNASSYLFGAQLSWNILEGTQRFAKTQKSKAALNKAEFQYRQFVVENQLVYNKAKRMVRDAQNHLQLSEQSVQQSEESLRIRANRFAQGLEKTTDLLQSETQLAQKKMEYFTAIFQYNQAIAYMDFLSKGQD